MEHEPKPALFGSVVVVQARAAFFACAFLLLSCVYIQRGQFLLLMSFPPFVYATDGAKWPFSTSHKSREVQIGLPRKGKRPFSRSVWRSRKLLTGTFQGPLKRASWTKNNQYRSFWDNSGERVGKINLPSCDASKSMSQITLFSWQIASICLRKSHSRDEKILPFWPEQRKRNEELFAAIGLR